MAVAEAWRSESKSEIHFTQRRQISKNVHPDTIFLLFQLLEATYIPWLVAPSYTFKASHVASSLLSNLCFHLHVFFLTLSLLPLSNKAPCDYTGPIQIIQANLPISG